MSFHRSRRRTRDPIPRFFFFNDTATTEIYTLSLHDALPIYSGYRGEIRVVLVNHDPSTPVTLARGDRIAQLVVQRVEQVELIEVHTLPESARGSGGFGSSGI